MDWLRPALLWGLVGASLPLIIHLIGRRRRRVVRVATLRFLERAAAKSGARMKLKQLLLLFARMAAVGFLTFLFAGPGMLSLSATEARSLVLVVDTSASMSAARSGKSRIDEARERLAAIVDESAEGDRFAIVTTARDATLQADPFTDRIEARKRILALNVAENDGGIPAALDLAAALLRERSSAGVVLATDMQKTAWQGGAGARLGLELSIVDVGFADPANAWIEALELSGGVAKVKPAFIGASTRTSVVMGGEGKRTVTAFLERGGEAEFRAEETAEVKPVAFRVEPGGDLAWDDSVTAVPSASGQVKVLLVNGDPRSATIADELHFARIAFSSGGRMQKNILASEIRQAELTTERAAGYDVVLLANPGPVSEELALGLKAMVEKGLGLIVTAGDRWSPERGGDHLGLLVPAGLRDRAVVAADDPVRPPFEEVAQASFKSPFATQYGSERGRPPRVTGYWLLETSVERTGRVIARYANQLPFLAERKVGRGKLLLLTTTIDRDWSDLCLRPDFVPFLEKLTLYGAGRAAGSLKPLAVKGEKVQSPFAEPVELTSPSGTVSIWPEGELAEAKETGFYRLSREGRLLGGFYVRPDPRESDLTRFTDGERRELASSMGFTEREGVAGGRARRDLSGWAAAAVLAALGAEALLSARRRSRGGEPFDFGGAS